MTFKDLGEKPRQLPVPVEKVVDVGGMPMPKELTELDRLAREAVEKVMAEKGDGEFFNMIPEAYRSRVLNMVDGSYAEKGAGRSRKEFTEAMALGWLAKREVFKEVGRMSGFKEVESINRAAKTPIIVMTVSGSIVAMTVPSEGGERGARYWKIPERKEAEIPPEIKGALKGDPRIGEKCIIGNVETSMLIGILANPKAPINVDDVSRSMSESFVTVARVVDERGQSVHVQAPRDKAGIK